jgi:protein involved in polysaccharide export with SLBB domain
MFQSLGSALLLVLLHLCFAPAFFSQRVVNSPTPAAAQSAESKEYYVAGCAKRPGVYEWHAGMTVLDAIKQSGGLAECSNGHVIYVVRGNRKLRCDYKQLVSGENPAENISFLPGDHVIVP